ncbi:MAG: UDP-N-acetylglucosamine 2-epimerase, partial [Nanoarchaeota archaeon]|nr:UDP-N-acetylglucosamine 2-epimerase [Nanoarchaeota archaeon]
MIHVILGTKAQLIKMAPVMKELADRNIGYNFIFTGQHKETIGELIEVFKLKSPDYTLYNGADITKISQMFFWILKCLWQTIKNKKIIFKNKKGIILVHGDTASTLLGTLMAKIGDLKIGYIEAGLRSFNLLSPFPEEIVRRITSRLADYHFCPGAFACGNSEKYKGEKINTKENTLLDSLGWVIKNEDKIDVNIPEEKYCLVSIHRFENIFNRKRLSYILGIFKEIFGIRILFILHKPTKEKLIVFGFYEGLEKDPRIELRPRYDYFRFIKLLRNSEFLITDGGSNQEESYYLGKPCLVMRKTTERKEGLGKNVIISEYNQEVI